ncbi:MAG: AarF/ABC1/UbiB kinase family protein [Oligoflexales bacterium]|nr:AarF/ABC1/UbiB kinase family protein [Oligoflexales bacterium]
MRNNTHDFKVIESSVFEKLDKFKNESGVVAAKEHCVEFIGNKNQNAFDLKNAFFYVLWILKDPEISAFLTDKELDEWVKCGEFILMRLGVKPYTSRASTLYGELYRVKSQILSEKNFALLPVWNYHIASSVEKSTGLDDEDDLDFEEQCSAAHACFTLGYIAESLDLYLRLEVYAKDFNEAITAKIGILKALRILGKYESTLDICYYLESTQKLSGEQNIIVSWETALARAARGDGNACLIDMQKKIDFKKSPAYAALSALWIYSSRSRDDINKVSIGQHVKNSNLKSGGYDRETFEILEFYLVVESLYKSKEPILAKMKNLGVFLENVFKRRTSEGVILFLCAVIRWLYRNRQHRFAIFIMNEYQSRSAFLSNGKIEKLHNLLGDIDDKLNFIGESTRHTSQKRDLATGIARTLTLAELTAKVTFQMIKMKGKEWFRGEDKSQLFNEFWIKLSNLIADYAGGELKGPVQKLAHSIFLFQGLPDEVLENMKKILWTSKVIERKVFEKILEEDTGRKIGEMFSEFSNEPIGIGSTAQVYKARLKSGEWVAVKILYPGMDKVVKTDLKIIKRFVFLLNRASPLIDKNRVYEIIHNIFTTDIDLKKEAELYSTIGKMMKREDGFIVPRVYDELSSSRVLVTEYVSGLNFYEYMETCDQNQKAIVFEKMYRFTYFLRFGLNILQMDPHPGNFLFLDDKLVCIDFGCLYHVSDSEAVNIWRIHEAIISEDPEILFHTMVNVGYLDLTHGDMTPEIRHFLSVMVDCCYLKSRDGEDPLSRFIRTVLHTKGAQYFTQKALDIIILFIADRYLHSTMTKLNLECEGNLPFKEISKRLLSAKQMFQGFNHPPVEKPTAKEN